MFNPKFIIWGIYALFGVFAVFSLRLWYHRWSERRLYKAHRQENIDAEREWNEKRARAAATAAPSSEIAPESLGTDPD
jgi:hypothetical protein